MSAIICRKCSTLFDYAGGRGRPRVFCDDCSRAASQRRYRDRHPEAVKAAASKWRAENPGKAAAASSRWRAENAAKVAADRQARWADPVRRAADQANYRAWAERNRDKLNAKSSEWQKANPEKVRARNDRRRARRKGSPDVRFSAEDWCEILVEFDHRCAYCFIGGVPLEQEHVVPLSRGGAHTRENIVPACVACNRRKSSKTAVEFLKC